MMVEEKFIIINEFMGCYSDRYGKNYLQWNNLMPVIDKIESMGYWTETSGLQGSYLFYIMKRKNINSIVSVELTDSKIQCVLYGVIYFIEWYNKNHVG